MDNDTAGAGVGAGAGAFAGADTVAGERNVGRMTRREIKALWKSAVTVGDWERLAHRLALSASAARVCGGTHESQRLERLASAARNLSAIVEARVHDEAVAIRAALRVRLDGITAAHVACVEPVLSSVRETMARVEGCDAGLQDTMDLIVRIEGEVAELQRRLSDARVRLASWDAERDDLLARLSSLCEEHDTFEQRAMELRQAAEALAEAEELALVLRTVDEFGRLRAEYWDAAWVGERHALVDLSGRSDGWFADRCGAEAAP